MYPHIDKFLDLLHGRGISSYLVTNATFPDAIKTLPPVTQLYTSIDGSTKEELKVFSLKMTIKKSKKHENFPKIEKFFIVNSI